MSKSNQKVLIVHVPYEHRGGEEVHVDALVKGYKKVGIEPILFPEDREPPRGLLGRSIKSLFPTSKFEALEAAWEKYQPDYIHLNNAFPILGPRFFRWAKEKSVPLVMTVHNHRFFCTNGLALRNKKICKDCFDSRVAWRPVVRNCNGSWHKSIYHSIALTELRLQDLYQKAVHKFVAPSPYLQAELVRVGMPKNRVIHILNPVLRSNDFSPNPKTSTSDSTKYDVLYAGRLSQEKGISELIKAAKLLPEISFVIVGDGPERNLMEAAQKENKNIFYLGPKRHEDVLNLIDQSQIAVLPSICNETLSTFALEVFYHGKRCVVPALDSTSWLAGDDFPGILAKTDDPEDLARAIKKALRSPKISNQERTSLQGRLGIDRFCLDLKSLAEGMA